MDALLPHGFVHKGKGAHGQRIITEQFNACGNARESVLTGHKSLLGDVSVGRESGVEPDIISAIKGESQSKVSAAGQVVSVSWSSFALLMEAAASGLHSWWSS